MDRDQKSNYSARIAQANRSQLVVIIYELFLISIDEAKENYKKGENEKGSACVKKAQGFLQELMGSLDKRYEVSANLMSLYRYIYRQLIESNIKNEVINEEIIIEVMTKLKNAFVEVAKTDETGPVIKDVGQVYAGFTYGRSSLNEVLMSGKDYNSGIKA